MVQIVSRRTLTGTVHVGFLVVKIALRQTLLRVLPFPLLTFKRRIKYHLPFSGIIRSSPYSPR